MKSKGPLGNQGAFCISAAKSAGDPPPLRGLPTGRLGAKLRHCRNLTTPRPMLPRARHLLTLLHRFGLWVALPLLLAVLPYQQGNLHAAGQAAVSVQTPLALAAPLKPSFVKPALPETRARSIALLDSITAAQSPHRLGFHLLETHQPALPTVTQIQLGWQARAPPLPARQAII